MRFAQIGYGHGDEQATNPNGTPKGGRGKGGYTYLVADNVRKDQILQVIAHSHGKEGARAFPTTGTVLRTSTAQPEMPANTQPTNAYTNKELGVKQGFGTTAEQRQNEARAKALGVYNSEIGGYTGKEAESKFAITGGTKTEKLMNSYETYDAYVKRTGGFGGDKQ